MTDQYFRMTGSAHQVSLAVERLRASGWDVLSEPEPGPLDTWSMRVRRAATPPEAARLSTSA